MRGLALLFVLLGVVAAGCGGTTHAATAAKQCPATTKALARINGDLAAMRRAPSHAALSSLTDKFILQIETAPLSNLQRNRLIDHAAAIVSIRCPDCFQALEAERPIPAIAHGDIRCPKA